MQRIESAQSTVNLCNLDVAHLAKSVDIITPAVRDTATMSYRRGRQDFYYPQEQRLETQNLLLTPATTEIFPGAHEQMFTGVVLGKDTKSKALLALAWRAEKKPAYTAPSELGFLERRKTGEPKHRFYDAHVSLDAENVYLLGIVRERIAIPVGRIALQNESCSYTDYNKGDQIDIEHIHSINDGKTSERYVAITKALRITLDLWREQYLRNMPFKAGDVQGCSPDHKVKQRFNAWKEGCEQ